MKSLRPLRCQFIFQSVDKLRLDLFLSQQTQQTRNYVQKQIRQGRVLINKMKITKTAHWLRQGDKIEVRFEDPSPNLNPEPGALDILMEDEHLLVINKTAGVVVHPSTTSKITLVHHLLHYFRNNDTFKALSPTRPGIVHRLDKGTTGCLLVAKNQHSHEGLAEQFRSRTIKKTYEAIVWGSPKLNDSTSMPIGRHPVHRKKMQSMKSGGRQAFTSWIRLGQYSQFAHLEVSPHTGRTHQIRVHLAHAGYPIVGDSTYGLRRLPKLSHSLLNAIHSLSYPLLHARQITFEHPVTRVPSTVNAPLPKDFAIFLKLIQYLN